jgi:transcriptional regulator with XRE-family HTH domain
MTFAETLKKLRTKAGKSRYRLAQYSGINEAYTLRLERGERANPSRDVVLMLGLALVESSDSVGIWDIDELLLSAGYAPLRRRGESGSFATASSP